MDKLKMKEIRKQVRFAEIEKERLFNFLKDDLEKLEKNVSVLVYMIDSAHIHYADTQKPLENINNFFSYWKQHINDLNK